jgi:hypothetical protein
MEANENDSKLKAEESDKLEENVDMEGSGSDQDENSDDSSGEDDDCQETEMRNKCDLLQNKVKL